MRYKGAIFDFDGTLLDSVSEGRRRFLSVAESLGLSVSEEAREEVRKLWGAPGYMLVQTCWPDMDWNTFMHEWETFDRAHPIGLFPGAKEVVEQLSVRLRLSMLTSRSWSTRFQLAHHGIESFFSFVYTLDDCPEQKPHPRSAEKLLDDYRKHHGIERHDLVLVGDSIHSDYGLARAVGMDFIAVSWGNNTREDFLQAGVASGRIVDSLDDLPVLFR